jgi:hypothetical protein
VVASWRRRRRSSRRSRSSSNDPFPAGLDQKTKVKNRAWRAQSIAFSIPSFWPEIGGRGGRRTVLLRSPSRLPSPEDRWSRQMTAPSKTSHQHRPRTSSTRSHSRCVFQGRKHVQCGARGRAAFLSPKAQWMAASRKYRSFRDDIRNRCNRPFAALLDRRHERAESARKRTLAEGVSRARSGRSVMRCRTGKPDPKQ